VTRINCIPVTELTREHLVAEYRELPRVFGLARMPREGEVFPEQYTLGAGHVKFFYTRLGWCANRHTELVQEMKRRGYNPTIPEEEMWHHCEKAGGSVPLELFKSWTPDAAAMELNRQRIRERLA
jgi:deoxyribonuclease (pyrimidine dimer)